jgi:hypothetical protein
MANGFSSNGTFNQIERKKLTSLVFNQMGHLMFQKTMIYI